MESQQSAIRRAINDTLSAQKSPSFMWLGEGMLAVAGVAWLSAIAPTTATTIERVARSVFGGLGGLVVTMLSVLAWNLFRAPYKQRDEARAEVERGQSELDDIKNVRPNVVFDSVSPERALVPTISLHPWSSPSPKQGYFLRLVFRNNVKVPSGDDSTAKGTTARIEVLASDNHIVDSWDGRWAKTNAPESYEDITVKNRYDIPANDTAILDVGFRIVGQLQFQGHDNRHVSYNQPLRETIHPGSYYVRVELRASNMGVKEFWFILNIPNKPQSDFLNQVWIKPASQKPDLYKEGS